MPLYPLPISLFSLSVSQQPTFLVVPCLPQLLPVCIISMQITLVVSPILSPPSLASPPSALGEFAIWFDEKRRHFIHWIELKWSEQNNSQCSPGLQDRGVLCRNLARSRPYSYMPKSRLTTEYRGAEERLWLGGTRAWSMAVRQSVCCCMHEQSGNASPCPALPCSCPCPIPFPYFLLSSLQCHYIVLLLVFLRPSATSGSSALLPLDWIALRPIFHSSLRLSIITFLFWYQPLLPAYCLSAQFVPIPMQSNAITRLLPFKLLSI